MGKSISMYLGHFLKDGRSICLNILNIILSPLRQPCNAVLPPPVPPSSPQPMGARRLDRAPPDIPGPAARRRARHPLGPPPEGEGGKNVTGGQGEAWPGRGHLGWGRRMRIRNSNSPRPRTRTRTRTRFPSRGRTPRARTSLRTHSLPAVSPFAVIHRLRVRRRVLQRPPR